MHGKSGKAGGQQKTRKQYAQRTQSEHGGVRGNNPQAVAEREKVRTGIRRGTGGKADGHGWGGGWGGGPARIFRGARFVFSRKEVYLQLFAKNTITNNQIPTVMAYVISDDCVACGTCIDECPSGAISEGEKYSIDPDTCVDCGTCADVCPSGAISPGE